MQNLFHIFRVHNRVVRSRDLVLRTCHAVLRVDSSRDREEFEKSVWLQTLTILFFSLWLLFNSRRSLSSQWASLWTTQWTNQCRIETFSRRSAIFSRDIISIYFVEHARFFFFLFVELCSSMIKRCVRGLRTLRDTIMIKHDKNLIEMK
jgi:hypothetical protein